ANRNKVILEKRLGREVGTTDLYLAHLLGPGGAAKFLEAHQDNSAQKAAKVVPEAARTNPTIFYDDGRSARSVAGVYDRVQTSLQKPMRQFAALAPELTPTVPLDANGDVAGPAGPVRVASADMPPPIASGPGLASRIDEAIADQKTAAVLLARAPVSARPGESENLAQAPPKPQTVAQAKPAATGDEDAGALGWLLGNVKRSLLG
ncbi:MAG: hypothetical protein K2Q10_06205, partial [Rhodospirillales bacterium]|nr:hypothetical protein [Rhodospirillales bacterium]